MADHPLMSLRELADAVGGRLIGAPATVFTSVSIDSRSVASGSLFIALMGERNDGSLFVADAFSRGAVVALVPEKAMTEGGGALKDAAQKANASLVVVDAVLPAFQAAAAAYLDKFPRLLKIGLTGSSGKTTTKELAAAMIGAEKRTSKNEGNLNSETGLPLSLFRVREEHQAAVFELGMNRPNEIRELARTLRPRIALITNIGTAHIGILGEIGAIAEEKKGIFSAFLGDETAILPEDDPFAKFLAEGLQARVRYHGPKSSASYGGAKALGLDGFELTWAGKPVHFALPGVHNLRNALAAAALATEAGVSDEAIRAGLASARPLFGRGEILRGRVTLIRDCYNANPESLAAAISYVDSLETDERRVYVIGSMLELGDKSQAAHERLGELLARSKAALVVLFGAECAAAAAAMEKEKAAKPLANKTPELRHFLGFDELSRFLASAARPGDLVLLKGSRGTELERLSEAFLKGEGA